MVARDIDQVMLLQRTTTQPPSSFATLVKRMPQGVANTTPVSPVPTTPPAHNTAATVNDPAAATYSVSFAAIASTYIPTATLPAPKVRATPEVAVAAASSSNGLSRTTLIAVIAGSVVLVVLLAGGAGAWWWIRKRREKRAWAALNESMGSRAILIAKPAYPAPGTGPGGVGATGAAAGVQEGTSTASPTGSSDEKDSYRAYGFSPSRVAVKRDYEKENLGQHFEQQKYHQQREQDQLKADSTAAASKNELFGIPRSPPLAIPLSSSPSSTSLSDRSNLSLPRSISHPPPSTPPPDFASNYPTATMKEISLNPASLRRPPPTFQASSSPSDRPYRREYKLPIAPPTDLSSRRNVSPPSSAHPILPTPPDLAASSLDAPANRYVSTRLPTRKSSAVRQTESTQASVAVEEKVEEEEKSMLAYHRSQKRTKEKTDTIADLADAYGLSRDAEEDEEDDHVAEEEIAFTPRRSILTGRRPRPTTLSPATYGHLTPISSPGSTSMQSPYPPSYRSEISPPPQAYEYDRQHSRVDSQPLNELEEILHSFAFGPDGERIPTGTSMSSRSGSVSSKLSRSRSTSTASPSLNRTRSDGTSFSNRAEDLVLAGGSYTTNTTASALRQQAIARTRSAPRHSRARDSLQYYHEPSPTLPIGQRSRITPTSPSSSPAAGSPTVRASREPSIPRMPVRRLFTAPAAVDPVPAATPDEHAIGTALSTDSHTEPDSVEHEHGRRRSEVVQSRHFTDSIYGLY